MHQMELVSPEEAGIEIVHHFSDGVYAKQINVPAGAMIMQHRHKFNHMSILASGTARVEVNGVVTEHIGPEVLNIIAGEHHAVYAITDIVWFCTHATDEKNPTNIDHTLIEEN